MIKMPGRQLLGFAIFTVILAALAPVRVCGEEPAIEAPAQAEVAPTAGETSVSTEGGTSVVSLTHIPLSISVFTRDGYDDNSRQSGSGQGSFFTDEGLSLSYYLTTLRTHLSVRTGADITYYPGQNAGHRNDINSYVDLSASENLSTRLKLDGSVYATYRTEPDFGSNVGPENVRANFFTTNDRLSARYDWTSRIATVTNYKFELVRYDNSNIGNSQNRVDNTIGEEFRFNWLSPNNTLLAEYRYEVLNYSGTTPDSATHYALVGFDESFSQQLRAVVRGGATYRSYTNGDKPDRIDPHFESSVSYSGAHHGSISWTTSYGIEEASTPDVSARTTFRTGLRLRYGVTDRITATLDGYYHHDENEGGKSSGGSGTSTGGSTGVPTSGFSEDSFDIAVAAHYVINRHFTFDLNYERAQVSSGVATRSYSRNRYYAGLTLTY